MQRTSTGHASAFPISLGLFLFGFAVTYLAGLSDAKGTSTQLLTAVFGFAGGSILTFAGFQRSGRDRHTHDKQVQKPSGESESEHIAERNAHADASGPAQPRPVVDLRQTGFGLAAFAAGMIFGAPAGIAIRLFGPHGSREEAPPVDVSATARRATEAPSTVGSSEPAKESPAQKQDGRPFALQTDSVNRCELVARRLMTPPKDADSKPLVDDVWALWSEHCCKIEQFKNSDHCRDRAPKKGQ